MAEATGALPERVAALSSAHPLLHAHGPGALGGAAGRFVLALQCVALLLAQVEELQALALLARGRGSAEEFIAAANGYARVAVVTCEAMSMILENHIAAVHRLGGGEEGGGGAVEAAEAEEEAATARDYGDDEEGRAAAAMAAAVREGLLTPLGIRAAMERMPNPTAEVVLREWAGGSMFGVPPWVAAVPGR